MNDNYVCVIGGTNIDIYSTPYNKLNKGDSVPGISSFSFGGVGRNIAENLALLGEDVKFITAIGDDTYSKSFCFHCSEKKINLEHSIRLKNKSLSSYICLNDKFGEMQWAIADMENHKEISPDFLKAKIDIINSSVLCIIDTNLSEEAISFITKNCTVPIFADPVSTTKAKKLSKGLNSIHTLKPNILEAELLSGINIHTISDVKEAAKVLLERGVKNVFITMGSNGVYFLNNTCRGLIPAPKLNTTSTTGAGDSFIATLAFSYINGLDITLGTKMAMAASSLCLTSKNSVYQGLSYKKLKNIALNMEVK